MSRARQSSESPDDSCALEKLSAQPSPDPIPGPTPDLTPDQTPGPTSGLTLEAQLLLGEVRYRTLFESNPHPMWVYDLETLRFMAVNDAATVHYGYSHAEFGAMTIADIRPLEDLDRLRSVVNSLSPTVDRAGMWRHLKRDGTPIEVEITAHPLEFGRRKAVLVLAVDITEQRRAVVALKQSEARYRTLFNSIDQGFCIFEMVYDTSGKAVDYRFLEVNSNFERHSGLADAVGRTALELVPGLEQHWMDLYANVVATGDPFHFEQGSGAMGRWFEVDAVRVGDASSRRVALLFTDVSERRRVQRSLEAEARRASFRAALSEALRTQGDPNLLQNEAARLLGEHLGAGRVFYGEVAADGERAVVVRDYTLGLPSFAGVHPMANFGAALLEQAQKGQPARVPDVQNDPQLSALEKEAYQAVGVGANLAVPVLKGGQLRAFLVVHHRQAYPWPAEDVLLVEETAERTWAALERLQVATTLRDNENRLQRALEASRSGTWEYDPRSREVIFDGLYGPFFGIAAGPGSLPASQLESLTAPEDRSHNTEVMRVALETGPGVEFETEYRVRVAGQSERWLFSRGRVELHQAGLRLVGTVTDITERKQDEARLRHLQDVTLRFSEAQTLSEVRQVILEDLLTALGADGGSIRLIRDGVLVIDEYRLGHQGFAPLTPLMVGQVGAAVSLSLVHPASETVQRGEVVFLQDAADWVRRYPHLEASVQDFGVQASAHLPLTRGQEVFGVLSLYQIEPRVWDERDRSFALSLAGRAAVALERARLFEALCESEARYRDLAEVQKRFVNDAAHELRAPLTAIQGNLEILERYPQMTLEDRDEALKETHEEAVRLSRLVGDMLALARGDAGDGLRKDPVRLDRVLEAAFHTVRAMGSPHALELGFLPEVQMLGDADRLKQLVLILLENALRYTPDGGRVLLTLERGEHLATVRIVDSGIGIAPEDLEKVFERFYRTDKARVQVNAGTGLGLPIARWIVEQHGGRVWLESELGQGTTAVLELPLER